MKNAYRGALLLSALIIAAGFVSCSPKQRVKTGLDALLADPAAYAGTEVIVATTIADVLGRYALYQGKWIEITAPLSYYGRRGYWTWYLMLEDGRQQLRCYTHYYRLSVGRDAENLLLRARAERGLVTVNGFLRNDGIDVREIWYDNQLVRPNVKPPEMLYYPWFM